MRFPVEKYVRFLVAGLPGLFVAFPLNWFLVVRMEWPFFAAYALVLIVQVSVNFMFCRWFVFDVQASSSVARQYLFFVSGILLYRVADWLLYVVLVHFLSRYFFVVQVFNALVFSVLKFKYSSKVMESKI